MSIFPKLIYRLNAITKKANIFPIEINKLILNILLKQQPNYCNRRKNPTSTWEMTKTALYISEERMVLSVTGAGVNAYPFGEEK